ncbi:hypothetical protein K1719_003621 [Acacia pycnantha]|nr:hypothetical protein K1719_003621 [Acacia pycnantha]
MEIETGEFCGGMTNTNGHWEKRVDPRWVPLLLDACKKQDSLEHSSSCNPNHKFLPNFCVTCMQLYCRSCPEFKRTNNPHQHHVVLLVCKASHENCLHASEVSKLIDISDIHLFIFNRREIVFLHRRGGEQTKSRCNKSGYACKTCGREFHNDKKFCSVQCKSESGENLERITQKSEGEELIVKPQSNLLRLTVKQKARGENSALKPQSNLLGQTKQNAKGEKVAVMPQSYRKRSRKGVPSRPLPFIYPVDLC